MATTTHRPSYRERPTDNRELFKKFKVLKFLGKGSYGSVYKVRRISDGQIYAVKEANIGCLSQARKNEAVNEIRLLASIKHRHIISYNEAFIDGNLLCIIMEYATNGDLDKYIKKGKQLGRHFPEETIWNFVIQICLGLQIVKKLHQNRVIHRDVKPMNVFVGDREVIKLGDLGIAKYLRTDFATTQIGTPHYMPPEIWRNKPYSYECDLYSLGCLLYEMMTYRTPFEAKTLHTLKMKVLAGNYSPLPADRYSKELTLFCKALLRTTPSKRITLETILTSPFVRRKVNKLPLESFRPIRRKSEGDEICSTIKVPKNISLLNKHLPPPNYGSDDPLLDDLTPRQLSNFD